MAEYKGSAYDAARQAKLEKERSLLKEKFERKKEQILKESDLSVANIGNKFATQNVDVEAELKRDTVGLMTFVDFQKKRELLGARKDPDTSSVSSQESKKEKKLPQSDKSKLSFDHDEVEAEPEIKPKKVKLGKDPTVDSSFLPDKDREEQERIERERQYVEWVRIQEEIKNEPFELYAIFWDGKAHQVTVKCKKGDSVIGFLEGVKRSLPILRNVHPDNLMLIKDELIIPHHHTFYEFFISKKLSKFGSQLFDTDTTKPKLEEGQGARVVERRWYEKHKHLLPANRWECYYPDKEYYQGRRTLADST